LTELNLPDQEVDTSAVENLMQVLVKGLRALQLYLPNNPIYQKAAENIRNAFEPVWEECAELNLLITESEFKWEDAVVLSQPDRADSVPWVLFKDGVRFLTLSPGIEDEEIVQLLDVLHKARALTGDSDDDLLTLLWEQDFQFVRYVTIELGEEGVPPLEPTEASFGGPEGPSDEELKNQVAEDAQQPEPSPTIVNVDDFDSTLYFLDDDELKYIESEIEREYSQDLRGNVLSLVFDRLELQTFAAVRTELISILENFIPYLLGAGDFRSVAYILTELRVILERARELLPEHRKQLEAMPGRLSDSHAIGQLMQSLDEAVVHPTEEELAGLFSELRAEALVSVLEWLPQLSNQRVRDLLENAAQRLVQAHPDQVARTLETDNETVLLGVIRLISGLKLPTFVPALGGLLTHDSPAVRAGAAHALASIGSPGAMKQLERAIDDSDRDVRITAVRVLSEGGHRGAFSKIEAAVNGKLLKHADLTEKKAFYQAYGALAGYEGLAALRPLLTSKGILKRKEDPETRACAAMALGKIGGGEARDLLSAALKDEKDPLVRNAINGAIREMK
jgi:HEAT repeat protein